ncbi:MAG: serine protease [Clostridia bacterium]|nr:serine protease [Clostridia bacterium]
MKLLKKLTLLASVFLCFSATGCTGGQVGLKEMGDPFPAVQTSEEWWEEESGEVDYAALTNHLTQVTMKGMVTIKGVGGLGSGFIYTCDEDEYYVLTNNHVVYNTQLWGGEFTVVDCYGTQTIGEYLCGNADYDLAILKFDRGRNELNPIEFAQSNPVVGQEVVSLGSPYGQVNAITYGKVLGYKYGYIQNNAASAVRFDCIEHDAWMAIGSSGGLLTDVFCKAVGVNFAIVPYAATGAFKSGMTVPVEKVKEFLALQGYTF